MKCEKLNQEQKIVDKNLVFSIHNLDSKLLQFYILYLEICGFPFKIYISLKMKYSNKLHDYAIISLL